MSILNVNQIQPVGSGQTVTISAANLDITGNLKGVTSSGISTFSSGIDITGGQLRIGTTSGDGTLRVFGDSGRVIIGDTSVNYYDADTHIFRNYAAAQKVTINSSGNIVLAGSGQGIDFSATSDGTGTVNDEVLAEYERGTWTPVLASLTGGTQPVVTTSTASGAYVRIGAMVYIEFLMIVTAVTTQGTGNIGVTGLPFTTSGNAYGNNIGITYNDIWDTAFREMYVTGSSLQMIPLGVTQSNATYGGPSNSQGNLSTGYFSVAGWYLRS